jgi:hypothetical protein
MGNNCVQANMYYSINTNERLVFVDGGAGINTDYTSG